MPLFKKNKQENNSFELGKNNLSELPPLPEDNFSEEDLEEIDEEELKNENEDLEEEVEEEVPTPDYKKVQPKPTTKEVPVKEEVKEPDNFNKKIMGYLIELKDYSIKLEEVLISQQERLTALESFAFRVKSS